MLPGLEGLGSRVMPDLVHRLIRFERRSCRDFRLHHAAVLGSLVGTSVVACFVAEIQLMSRDTATPISRPVYMISRSFNLNPVIDARPR